MEEQEKKDNSFLKGIATGLGISVIIAFLAFSGVRSIRYIQSVIQIFQPSDTEITTVTDSSVVDKLGNLEEIIEEDFLWDIEASQLEEGMYRGLMEALDDPYSTYYSAEELEEVQQKTNGVYYGIGAYVGYDADAGYAQISSVMKGTPAEESGLLAGDYLYMVDGEDMYEKSTEYVVSKIKGEEGTYVTLSIIREGESEALEIEVQRRQIDIITVEYEMLEDDVAYIQITQFDMATTDQFAQALADARSDGMKSLIIDLRGNPGGTLVSVCDVARMLLPKGLIVYTEDKDGKRTEYTCDGTNEIDVPLAVLIDGNSASASEILAGAIKDHGVGTLVGTTSYGKGIVQQIYTLKDGSAVKLTVSNYFTPNGNNIHGTGIEPDVEVLFDSELYLEGVDNQLEEAIRIVTE